MGIGALRRHYKDRGQATQTQPAPLVPSAGSEAFDGFMEEQMKSNAFAKALKEEAEKAGVPLEAITKSKSSSRHK